VLYSNIVGPYEVERVRGKKKYALTTNLEYSKKKGKEIEYKFLGLNQVKPQFHLVEELRKQHKAALTLQNQWRVKKHLVPSAPTPTGLMAVSGHSKEDIEDKIASCGRKRKWMQTFKKVGLVQRVAMLSQVVREKELDLENSMDTFQSEQMHAIPDNDEPDEMPYSIEDPALRRKVKEHWDGLKTAFDNSGGGQKEWISPAQLREALANNGITMTAEHFDDLVAFLDPSGNGKITHAAFYNFFFDVKTTPLKSNIKLASLKAKPSHWRAAVSGVLQEKSWHSKIARLVPTNGFSDVIRRDASDVMALGHSSPAALQAGQRWRKALGLVQVENESETDSKSIFSLQQVLMAKERELKESRSQLQVSAHEVKTMQVKMNAWEDTASEWKEERLGYIKREAAVVELEETARAAAAAAAAARADLEENDGHVSALRIEVKESNRKIVQHAATNSQLEGKVTMSHATEQALHEQLTRAAELERRQAEEILLLRKELAKRDDTIRDLYDIVAQLKGDLWISYADAPPELLSIFPTGVGASTLPPPRPLPNPAGARDHHIFPTELGTVGVLRSRRPASVLPDLYGSRRPPESKMALAPVDNDVGQHRVQVPQPVSTCLNLVSTLSPRAVAGDAPRRLRRDRAGARRSHGASTARPGPPQ
jgi:hypothetical protein